MIQMLCFTVMLGAAKVREHIDRGSGTIQYILQDAEILVHNLTYNKEVGFHINVDAVWRNLYTSYSHSLMTGGGRIVEVWKIRDLGELLKQIPVTTPIPPKPTFQFAVFYHNLDWDTWYWNNNYGQDYFLQAT
ncbi:MAG: hypothetical protein ACRERE_43985 [Candidatus Entotheonellia bacterium]